MPDRPDNNPFYLQAPDIVEQPPPLPPWLARRVLRPDETVTWVYGPRFSPSWERYVTHPALFLAALALGALCVLAGWLTAEGGTEGIVISAFAAGGLVLGSIFVLALFSGYFTRLVVTNYQLVILQGYEVCRSWSIDELPRSLVRYRMLGGGAESRAIDLDALQTMLGSASDKFAESKAILAFGKRLDQIKTREDDRA